MPAWLDHTSVKFFSSFFMGLQSEQRRTKAQSILSLTASSPQLNGIHARSLAKQKKVQGKPSHLFGRSVFLPQSSEGNVLLPCNSLSKTFAFWSKLYVTNMWNQLYKTAPRPSVILLIALFSWLVLFILVFVFVSRVPQQIQGPKWEIWKKHIITIFYLWSNRWTKPYLMSIYTRISFIQHIVYNHIRKTFCTAHHPLTTDWNVPRNWSDFAK